MRRMVSGLSGDRIRVVPCGISPRPCEKQVCEAFSYYFTLRQALLFSENFVPAGTTEGLSVRPLETFDCDTDRF